ncbi:MAG: hypothetical protein HY545_00480, partial [Candidatus Doudnabacteria bacterium]|nr:hypothetical protein [Candidatus Doudnabacteria bacterium]
PPLGRLRIISGIKNTTIIDDTYNAAPDSTIAALDALQSVGKQRKLLALGHMTELGKGEKEGIKKVAAKIMEIGLSTVFLVGSQAEQLSEQLAIRKFPGKVFKFITADAARIPVQNELTPTDTILVKGSQAARMEKIVKEIMAEPLKAEQLLVRQSKDWLKKM